MKKNQRSQSKWPGFKSSLNLKTRTEEINDIDYIDKLNDKDKQWLHAFNEEWINAKLDHHGKKFHKTKKARKIIYDKNNARNRDIFSKAKASNNLNYIADEKVVVSGSENPEEKMILEYDLKFNGVTKNEIFSGNYSKGKKK